jgi:hypothetical protein
VSETFLYWKILNSSISKWFLFQFFDGSVCQFDLYISQFSRVVHHHRLPCYSRYSLFSLVKLFVLLLHGCILIFAFLHSHNYTFSGFYLKIRSQNYITMIHELIRNGNTLRRKTVFKNLFIIFEKATKLISRIILIRK